MENTFTQKQYEALEILISESKDITTEAKRIILWLLRKSELLTKPVCVSIDYESHRNLAIQAANSVHNTSNYLRKIFTAMGSDLHLSFHCGKYNGSTFIPRENAYTIWLTEKNYGIDCEFKKLTFSKDEIAHEKIRNWYSGGALNEFIEDKTSL
ncbi:hypothetical protein A3B93_00650 [Candidatus Nomurabacteria bacterium RIFCSPHIGHO2_02_FULL_42_24]|uniref:Uncharacterized protein n=1 Tax=Candidatus Nomurabacteria bacterium RIFCSPHIGHO2_02_FULL_42_24 TaxID=1801757 RepID=A0A1F6WJW3_9BACT|nr:MAG: hypothetical protein A3B93_00650 [Candidatus Nomurabacteria bacterium RIFCSPHIGHO2_02_FULL_42_24]